MKNIIVAKIMFGSCSDDLSLDDEKAENDIRDAQDLDEASAIKIISKYIGCSFDVNNTMSDTSSIISTTEEIECKKLKITEIDYDEYEFPRVCAEATFEIESPIKLTNKIISNWEKANDDSLVMAVNFYWKDAEDKLYFDGEEGITVKVA